MEATFHLDKRAADIAANVGDDDDLLTVREAAAILSVSIAWMEARRFRGDGPPFIRIGARGIRYRRDKLREWIGSRAEYHAQREYSGEAA